MIVILGLILLYSYIHLWVLIFNKLFKQCTVYEKVVVVIATMWLSLTILWIILESFNK